MTKSSFLFLPKSHADNGLSDCCSSLTTSVIQQSVAALHYCCQKNFPLNSRHLTVPASLWSPQVSAASLKHWCWVSTHYKAQVLQRCCVSHCHNENPAPSICQLYLAHSAFSLTLGKLKGFKNSWERLTVIPLGNKSKQKFITNTTA